MCRGRPTNSPGAAALPSRRWPTSASSASKQGAPARPSHEHPTLKNAPLVALVAESEAARLDLSLGLDDLLLFPYRLSELAARLRLLAYRQESQLAPGAIRIGRLTLDEATYEVRIDGAPVDLTLKEYQLLLFLVKNPNRVFTREELLDRVWGDEYYGGTRTVDVHVRRVRAKTEAAGEMIETVRGVGYRLGVQETAAS